MLTDMETELTRLPDGVALTYADLWELFGESTDGKRYELFGAGGGDDLADRLGAPLLGQIPLVTELRAGGDSGRPIVLCDPTGQAAEAFGRIAERIEVELAPTRRYRKELKLL